MSEQRLQELLRDRVADVAPVDLASTAWQAAQQVRRRRVAAALAGAAAGVVAVIGGVSLLGPDEVAPQPAPAPSRSPNPQLSEEEPDAVHDGVPVWWSPDVAQEQELPWVDSSALPRDVDVAEAAVSALPLLLDPPEVLETEPMERAVAAFAVASDPGVVVLLGADGQQRLLDTKAELALESWRDVNTEHHPTSPHMLSPDGRWLLFQQEHGLVVFDIKRQGWRPVPAPEGTSEYARWYTDPAAPDRMLVIVPREPNGEGPVYTVTWQGLRPLEQVGTGSALPGLSDLVGEDDLDNPLFNPRGQQRRSPDGTVAQSWGEGGPMLPVRDNAKHLAGSAHLGVSSPRGTLALAFMTGFDEVRGPEMPAAVGWLDHDTVVYQSVSPGGNDHEHDLLIAWDVGTDDFHRVTSIRGALHSSFADLVG